MTSKIIRQRDLENLWTYVLVHQKDSEDLLFYQYRLGVEDAPQKITSVSKKLGIKLKNTGIGLDGEGFIGNINREQALKLNLLTGSRTATIREFMDYHFLLEQGVRNNKAVYNGAGRRINYNRVLALYADLQAHQDPIRGEFLDGFFGYKYEIKLGLDRKNIRVIRYEHRLTSKGDLLAKKVEPLEKRFTKDDYIDITSLNRQGLPKRGSTRTDFYFYVPISCVVFTANSIRTLFHCGLPYDCSSHDFGVRPVRIRK